MLTCRSARRPKAAKALGRARDQAAEALGTAIPARPAWGTLLLTTYALGLGLTLLAVALAGQRLVRRLGWLADPDGWFRRGLGVVFVLVGVAIVGAMNFSSLFAYLAASSFLFQDVYGMDAQQFGLLFGVNSLGLAVCSQISSRVMRRVGPQWVVAVMLTMLVRRRPRAVRCWGLVWPVAWQRSTCACWVPSSCPG
mgnify:CR=1 FL=1